ncbi:MAG: hypothetical protein IJZ55_11880 [Lachnospiraceae bacterium]|nr:hypothetical protein [Lachnospiraceae bacterium]
MQNRYAGDVGDFGKIGLLRALEQEGLRVGVNWYLVGDESHNNDGKHVGYLNDKQYVDCDNELLYLLSEMVLQKKRSVEQLECLNALQTQRYYHRVIPLPNDIKGKARREWHKNAVEAMRGCDLVFLDPDNGLLPKSVGFGSAKSVKYVLSEEIIDYYKNGYSVVFYSHRTREQLDVYLERFMNLFCTKELEEATIKGISFKRGTIRDYFFLIHKEHEEKCISCLESFVKGKWGQHFSMIL